MHVVNHSIGNRERKRGRVRVRTCVCVCMCVCWVGRVWLCIRTKHGQMPTNTHSHIFSRCLSLYVYVPSEVQTERNTIRAQYLYLSHSLPLSHSPTKAHTHTLSLSLSLSLYVYVHSEVQIERNTIRAPNGISAAIDVAAGNDFPSSAQAGVCVCVCVCVCVFVCMFVC